MSKHFGIHFGIVYSVSNWMSGSLRIGTSGMVLPGSKKTFPIKFQSGSRLSYYSTLFNTLEINSTFYKLPRPATFEKSASEVEKKINGEVSCSLLFSIYGMEKGIYAKKALAGTYKENLSA